MTADQIIAFVIKCQQSPEPSKTGELCRELVEAIYQERLAMLTECSDKFGKILRKEPA